MGAVNRTRDDPSRSMTDPRRRVALIAFAAAALFGGCDSMTRAGVGPDARRELAFGRDAAAAWLVAGRVAALEAEAARAAGRAPPADAVSLETAVATGYLERLRLGFGSPFRLIDYALRDPRLDEDARRRVAWALLARVIDGAAYQLDPAALDRIGLAWQETAPGTGHHHVRIIENAVRESRDPRGGELAVRLGYALAATEGSLSERAPSIAAKAASLVRDRAIAREDALRLLRAAEQAHLDPLELLVRWRAERRFEVERPPLVAMHAEVEREAMEVAPRLAQALRGLTPKLEGVDRHVGPPAPLSLLSPPVAERLRAAADSLNMPPQTPVALAMRMYRKEMLDQPRLGDGERDRRERMADAALSEERFAADYAQLRAAGPRDLAPQLAALWAAVALRAYGQEPVWYPGSGGPSNREMEERFGLASVRFADEIPSEWRPYYRRMLESALVDLYRVLPALDLKGLQIYFGETGSPESSLALHDPRTRRIILPPATGAGTLAHEVAHDLDWQVARRKYRVRGDYASDYAVRQQQDRLATWVNTLSVASLDGIPTAGHHSDAHWRRPAEVFARNMDWFVAVSLGAEGRMNGYLSSVQDDVLTGYGTVRPPDVTGAAGSALLTILDEVAPVYPATRDAFLRTYGTERSLTPMDLVRRVIEAQSAGAARTAPDPMQIAGALSLVAPLREVEHGLRRGTAAIDEWICRAPGAAYSGPLEAARRQLVVEAAGARARGIALQQARDVAGRPGERWLARRMYGPTWSDRELDPALAELIEPLVGAARDVARGDVPAASQTFGLAAPPSYCAAMPLRLVDVSRSSLTKGLRP
jgi:hypothetical protein